MQSPSDAELLADYASRRSETAFARLVERYVALVHSAARRQVSDPHLAEEITQAVFILLARKAGSLGGKTVLAGWLCSTAHFAARDALRAERRRQQREQLAANMDTSPDAAWQQLAPLLDEAVAQLREADRNAIVLRYYEKRSLDEVGAALGIGADAAQKRVARALDKLRDIFAKRGVTLTGAAIAGVVSANAVQAAPVGLAVKISAAAVLAGTTLAATSAIVMTTLQKTIIGATLAVAVGTGIYEARQASNLRSQVRALQQQQAPLARQIEQLTLGRDEALRKGVMSASNSLTKPFNWRSVESSDYKQYIANLRAVGCPEETIRDIIRADVNKLYKEKKKEARRRSPKFKYWQPMEEYTRGYGRESWMKMFEMDEERDAVLRTLGIESDFDMKTLKRANEFDLMTDFLDDEAKKAQLLRLQKEFNDKVTLLGERSIPTLLKEMEDSVRQILTPEEARQYDLRLSVSGSILRNQLAAFEPSEQEFLAVFPLRRAFDVQFAPVDREETTAAERANRGEAWNELQEQIKKTLGAQRYADYETSQNQDFQQMYRVAKEADLGALEAKRVFAVRQQAEEQAARIRNDQSLTAEQRSYALEGIQRQTEAAIHTVLGEKGWDQFNRGSTRRWLDTINPQRFPQNTSPPRP